MFRWYIPFLMKTHTCRVLNNGSINFEQKRNFHWNSNESVGEKIWDYSSNNTSIQLNNPFHFNVYAAQAKKPLTLCLYKPITWNHLLWIFIDTLSFFSHISISYLFDHVELYMRANQILRSAILVIISIRYFLLMQLHNNLFQCVCYLQWDFLSK